MSLFVFADTFLQQFAMKLNNFVSTNFILLQIHFYNQMVDVASNSLPFLFACLLTCLPLKAFLKVLTCSLCHPTYFSVEQLLISVIGHIASLFCIPTHFVLYGGHNADFVFSSEYSICFVKSSHLPTDQIEYDGDFEKF